MSISVHLSHVSHKYIRHVCVQYLITRLDAMNVNICTVHLLAIKLTYICYFYGCFVIAITEQNATPMHAVMKCRLLTNSTKYYTFFVEHCGPGGDPCGIGGNGGYTFSFKSNYVAGGWITKIRVCWAESYITG